MKRHSLVLLALPLLAACAAAPPPRPAQTVQAGYASKPDFAKVEHDHPLTAAERHRRSWHLARSRTGARRTRRAVDRR